MGECMSAADAFHSSWNNLLEEERGFISLKECPPPQGPIQFSRAAHHSLLHCARMTGESCCSFQKVYGRGERRGLLTKYPRPAVYHSTTPASSLCSRGACLARASGRSRRANAFFGYTCVSPRKYPLLRLQILPHQSSCKLAPHMEVVFFLQVPKGGRRLGIEQSLSLSIEQSLSLSPLPQERTTTTSFPRASHNIIRSYPPPRRDDHLCGIDVISGYLLRIAQGS